MGRERQCQRCCQPLGMWLPLSELQFSHIEMGAGLSFGVVDPEGLRGQVQEL